MDVLADESMKVTNAVTDNCTSRALESPAVFMVSVLTWFVRPLKVDYQFRPCL